MAKDQELWKAAGKRLAAARKRLGYESRLLLASDVALAEPTVAKYEQGAREIPISLLFWFSEKHGINGNWIITGHGEMFDDPSKAPAPSAGVDPQLLRKLHRAARLAYKAAGHRLPDEDSVAVEAGNLYNALLQKVADVRETNIVEAVIPVLVDDLKARLSKADAEPGTGKRSAS
ncbi:helix-turn-helix domain-containing protein [Neorhizobium sp. T786]|uniref:helix-turn-helix domain-containing protein n=1 Tax=Pseudorhizobium xiangyangii TaxID=2883104 RepID=UPI001D001A14|nr:helix-turn-helix domain-containing protein [Neorhizobium xiangyangii]MCB5204213.1 helix-turn-helix domain-containing protein [Neorhizobium xiangyangii]